MNFLVNRCSSVSNSFPSNCSNVFSRTEAHDKVSRARRKGGSSTSPRNVGISLQVRAALQPTRPTSEPARTPGSRHTASILSLLFLYLQEGRGDGNEKQVLTMFVRRFAATTATSGARGRRDFGGGAHAAHYICSESMRNPH
jgi:hypothetical protein